MTLDHTDVRVERENSTKVNLDIRVELSSSFYTHKRKVETIWNILSACGGFFNQTWIVLNIIVSGYCIASFESNRASHTEVDTSMFDESSKQKDHRPV